MKKPVINNSTLVPIDFSQASMFALEHATAIAKALEEKMSTITLLHVIEGVNIEPVTSGTPPAEYSREALMVEGAKNKINQIIESFTDKGQLKFEYIITGGTPYKRIAEVAEWIKADTIVMGTHGGKGIQFFMGSNASKIVQIAPCPVITIKDRNYGKGYQNIVLPLDLTRETKQKVSWAIKMARYFDSTVHLVTVHESDEFLARRIKANMRQVENILEENDIKSTSTTLTEISENFAKATLKFAEEKNADIIIIMTQQERTFAEFIFGSYAQQIVNKSSIPVMCINPRADLQGIFEIGGI